MTPEREKHIREWVAVAPTLFGAASDWMKELLEEIDRLRAEALTKERLLHIIQCRECEARTGGDRTEESAAQTWNCKVEKKEAKNG